MIKTLENKTNNAIDIKKIIKGAITAILITLIFLTIFSIILTYTNTQEKTIPTVTIIITGISILVGGVLSTSSVKKNGMITGALVGLIYIITIYLISSILTKNFSFNISSIVMIFVSIFTGALGGIVGVNIK